MWQGTDQIRYWYCDTAMGIDHNAMAIYVEKAKKFIKDHNYEFISDAGILRDVHNPNLQTDKPLPQDIVQLSDKNWTAIRGVRDLSHIVLETPLSSVQRRSQSGNILGEDKSSKAKETTAPNSSTRKTTSNTSTTTTNSNNTSSARTSKRNYSNTKSQIRSTDTYNCENITFDYQASDANENQNMNIQVSKASDSSVLSNFSSVSSSKNSSILPPSCTATTRSIYDEDLVRRVAEINRLTALALDERLTMIQDSMQMNKVKEESLLLAHKDDLLKLTEQKLLLERQREETAVELMRRHYEESEKDLRHYYEFVRKEQRDYRRMIYEEDRNEAKKKRRHDRVDRIAEDVADRSEQETRESRAYFERLQIRQYRHELDRDESFRKTSSSRTNNYISTGVNLGKLEGTSNFCGGKDASAIEYHKMMVDVVKDNYINDNRILASHINLPSSIDSSSKRRGKEHSNEKMKKRYRKAKKQYRYYSSGDESGSSSSDSSSESCSSEESVHDIFYEENKILAEENNKKKREDTRMKCN